MNSKFGTALALSAVLLTGTAAAAINTQALVAPTKSNLGTGATALLPVDQVVSVTPGQTQNLPTTAPTAGSKQSQVANTQAPGQSVGSTPDVTTSKATQPATDPATPSLPSAASDPKVIYGNPNPSTGGDDANDDEDQSSEDQSSEDQSSEDQSSDGDDD